MCGKQVFSDTRTARYLIGLGSAWSVAMIAKYLFGDHAGLGVNGVVVRFGCFRARACWVFCSLSAPVVGRFLLGEGLSL